MHFRVTRTAFEYIYYNFIMKRSPITLKNNQKNKYNTRTIYFNLGDYYFHSSNIYVNQLNYTYGLLNAKRKKHIF